MKSALLKIGSELNTLINRGCIVKIAAFESGYFISMLCLNSLKQLHDGLSF